MAEVKVTRKDLFTWMRDVLNEISCNDEEDEAKRGQAIAMCEKYVEQLSKARKPTVNKEAEKTADEVAELIAAGGPDKAWTAKDIAAAAGEISVQKAAAALRKLVQRGTVTMLEKEHKSDPNSYQMA